jgi:malate dehydrogenase
LEGEYGYKNLYLGIPTVIGGEGVEKIIEIPLTEQEKKALDRSAESVFNVMQLLP